MWIQISIGIFLLVGIIVGIFLFGKVRRTESDIQTSLTKLRGSTLSQKHQSVDFASLSELPEPVQKYFHNVLMPDQKLIDFATFKQKGQLKIDPKSNKWSPFNALYVVSENPPGFVWDAKIAVAPLLHVRVKDAFVKGKAAGNVYLMSAIQMAHDEDKAPLNSGALYRYLAEAVWHPTALLPQSGVRWEAIDGERAVAHLTKSGISISLEFRFNNKGEITGIYTEDRFGRFGDTYIKYPWEGKFSDYRVFNGVKIPVKGEVGWHLPDGWWLFWQGEIVEASFEFRE